MMKQENLFRKLGPILDELNEQYHFLAQNIDQLNELELELFHANANFLADHIQIIKKLNQNKPPLILPVGEDTEISNELIQEVPVVPQPENVVVDSFPQEQFAMELPVVEEQIAETPVATHEVLEEKSHFGDDRADLQEAHQAIDAEVPVRNSEDEVFKLDNSPSTFEFILNSELETESFDYEAAGDVDQLFDRQLSEEEQRIVAQKRKINQPTDEQLTEEEDEIGPEPFLVKKVEEDEVPPAPTTPTGEQGPEAQIEPEAEPVEAAITQPVSHETPPTAPTPVTDAPKDDPNYKPTLNDLLAGKNATNVNQVSSSGIADLKQAISLNDKLLYIKDLFSGYNLAYAEAIDLVNKMPNFESADNFLKKNYAEKNNWADKQATVDKFYRILNERFKFNA